MPLLAQDAAESSKAARGVPTVEGRGSHIPYLDGLRGVSILMVLAAHAQKGLGIDWPSMVDWTILNSTLGVHVFFVISGFLITRLLLQERHKRGRIDLRAFYLRRIARIFPAFYTYVGFVAVLVATGALAIFWSRVASAATFTWNYAHLWALGGGANVDWLGHIWTLSIEEQFYLLWPSAIALLGVRKSSGIALGLAVAMPFGRLATYFAFPSMRGYEGMMFHTASDTILCGALAAIWYDGGARPFLERLLAWRFTGVVCLVSALVVIPALSEFVRGFGPALNPFFDGCVVALYLLWLLRHEPRTAGVFQWKPLTGLGLISYSLYLWQQPFTMPGPLHLKAPLNIGAAFVVACASYFLIERPSRGALRKRWGLDR